MVCGPNEPYLEETLQEFARLCDHAIIATCNATDREKQLINAYGFEQYDDNREWGRSQPDIKTDLLGRILASGAEWILVLDADETLPKTSRADLEAFAVGRESAQFYVVNLWNDPQHYKKSSGFWNVRFYKAMPEVGTQFLRKPVHCGNAPPYFYNQSAKKSYVPRIMLHKGLMDKEKRLAKVARYNTYDPYAQHKGREYYDMLATDTGSAEYVEADVMAKIADYCKQIGAL